MSVLSDRLPFFCWHFLLFLIIKLDWSDIMSGYSTADIVVRDRKMK